jgi:hypothetical protein
MAAGLLQSFESSDMLTFPWLFALITRWIVDRTMAE